MMRGRKGVRIHLTRWCGIRVYLKWDWGRRLAQIEPDEDDLAAAAPEAVESLWNLASGWATRWLACRPDWRVNGVSAASPGDEAGPDVPML